MDDSELNKYMTLLELSKFRYGEEERRNQLIDEKHKSLIAFLGVMITIQITVFPSIAEYFTTPLSVLDYSVCVVFILSLIFYTASIIYFICSLQYDEFESVPKTDAIMDYSYDVDCGLGFIIGNTICSFDKALNHNKNVIDNKINKGENGYKLLIFGVVFSVLFIISFILIFVF